MAKNQCDKTPRGLSPKLAVVLAAVVSLPTWMSAGLLPQKPRQTIQRDSLTIDTSTVDIRPMIPTANRYQDGKVFLEHADRWTYDERFGVPQDEQYQVLTGNVEFRKNDMFMYCDSAHFYETTNSFDAFKNVRMEQGDTLFVFADELNYNGSDEMAILYADASKKVRLINRDVELQTDVFNYSLAENVGFYEVGGKLTDKENELTSLQGEYHPDTKDAYFNLNVRLRSLNGEDTLRMATDSLEYNTDTHIATLIAPTVITSSDGEILSSSGNYNTLTGIADLYERSLVITNRGNTLTGDTLFYDRDRGIGEAFGNMILTDSARQSSVQGDYGFYNDAVDSAFVTGRALLKEYSKGDTLYMHGDTIYAYLDPADSTRITNVYRRVRFYRSDMQGVCDSLSATERDSMMRMFHHPIVWSDQRQVFGNVIHVHINDSTIDWAKLPQFGFMAEHIDEDCYQQMSGDEMTVWFNDSTIRRLFAEGTVKLIMFPMENDSTYNKYAYVESSEMDAYFANNDIESVHFQPETTSKIVPLYLAKKNSYFLEKFKWYANIRPTGPADVFVIPPEMESLMNEAPPAPEVTDKEQNKVKRRTLPTGDNANKETD